VRRDSVLQSLRDLRGRRFAYGDRDSTESHVIPQFMLIEAGVSDSALAFYKFLGSHTNVALAVLTGDYDADAVKEEVYQEYKARGLRALAAEPPVADHLFVASSKISAEVLATLRRTLLQPRHRRSIGYWHRVPSGCRQSGVAVGAGFRLHLPVRARGSLPDGRLRRHPQHGARAGGCDAGASAYSHR
jgi:hypothetical protein